MNQATPSVEVQGQRARYRVDAVLSRTGGVSVYQVRDPQGEVFAMKLLDAQDPVARQRFDDERQLASRLHHPSVVRVRDQGERAGQPFLIMELVEGRTLADLHRKGSLTVSDGVQRVAELARVVHAVHEGGVVHGDLQPGHVIVSNAGTLHLSGFGARAAGSEYAAPELASGAPADARSDVYGLGAILYELVTGQRPGPGPVTPPSRVSPAAPASLDAVLLEALSASPAARFPTALAFARELDAAATGLAGSSAPAGRGTSARSSLRSTSARSALGRSASARVASPSARAPAAAGGGGHALVIAAAIVALALGLALVLVARSKRAPVEVEAARAQPETASASPAEAWPVDPAPATPATSGPAPSPALVEAARVGGGDLPSVRAAREPIPQASAPVVDEPEERVDLSGVGELEPPRAQTAAEKAVQAQVRERLLAYDVDGMLAAAEQAEEELPESGWVQFTRALALLHHGRYWDALEAFDAAYALDPGLVLVNPDADRVTRALAKLQQGEMFDEGQPPSRDAWRPLFGGRWREEQGQTLAGSSAGFGPESLSMLVATEPIAGRGRLTTRLQLGNAQAVGLGAGGLVFGQPDPERSFVVVLLHVPAMLQRQLKPEQIEGFRREHGVFPKQCWLGELRGNALQPLGQWLLPFPDSGWITLEVRLQGRAIEVRVGDWSQRASLTGSAAGRWGLAKCFQGETRFRDWAFEPER